ncbi:MAG: hypothetical protein M1830_010293 [Pleopsidium flavum]|nr:MAG: hypothetical protein M1830_010293 [Pleopsidium flavum]
MRLHRERSLLPTLLLLPHLSSAVSIDCKHVLVDGVSFDISALDGPHSVVWSRQHPPSIVNTTFTVDVCKPLKRTKGVPKDDEFCGIEHTTNTFDNTDTISGVIPIAGNYPTESGRTLDPQWTRLKTSSSHADSRKEGVRLEMHGGMYPFDDRKRGRKQEAVIEFICDPRRTGLEDEDEEERRRDVKETEDDDDEEDERRSLRFISYGAVDEIDVLRLEWLTKHACEDAKNGDNNDDENRSRHWGFFTWFIVIAFLATATYLIFGSWLNYNRYGARGWDLLPHGDTIRDVPYLLRDWARRVVSTVQGGGSRGGGRGGYSAV